MKDIIGIEKNKLFLIVGAGATIKEYQQQIANFTYRTQPISIGINNMTHVFVPTYHLWTNKQRWGSFGSCVKKQSKLIFGSSIKDDAIKKYYKGSFIRLNYIDRRNVKIRFDDKKIYGFFRTAGTLAIMVAHAMGASDIYVVGMDGYTLHAKKSLDKKTVNQHCYGEGKTDDADWNDSVKKDANVYEALHELQGYGIKFKILTPTVFTDFYDTRILK